MLTRIWQNRYYGLLATLLVGVAAAVLVMLLPDRHQAFARFALSASAANEQAPQALMEDQRIVNRVLQQLEIEPPNLLDPRPVDPAVAFKQNFGLRATDKPGEFEISYVSRSPEKAAKGVQTWLTAANDVWRMDAGINTGTALNSPVVTDQTLPVEIELARTAMASALEQEQALVLEQSKLTEELAVVRTDLSRFDAAREQTSTAVSEAEQRLNAARLAVAQSNTRAEQAAERLAQLVQQQTQLSRSLATAQSALQAAQAAKTDFAQNDADRARSSLQVRVAQLDRQRLAIAEQVQQAVSRSEALRREFNQTPRTIVEVVTDEEPVASARSEQSRRALIEKTRNELAELRVRFTDNHPDVRRQLAILSDLESPGEQGNVIEAPTVGARPEVRPNPRFAALQEELRTNDARVARLRARQATLAAEREDLADQNAQVVQVRNGNRDTQAQNIQANIVQAEREVATARAAVTELRTALQQAEKRQEDATSAQRTAAAAVQNAEANLADMRAQLAGAQPTQSSSAQASTETPDAAQNADRLAQRQALDSQVSLLEATLASTDAALAEASERSRERTAALAALEAQLGQGEQALSTAANPTTNVPGLARGDLTVVQGAQVVPASNNPDRIRWLFFGLLASLAVGALLAMVLGARRTDFSSIAELEQATGLRALGGVPRFRSSRRTFTFWLSALFFVGLIALYGLVYFAFMALVDSQSGLLTPDWQAWRRSVSGLLAEGAARLGVGKQWLTTLVGNR